MDGSESRKGMEGPEYTKPRSLNKSDYFKWKCAKIECAPGVHQ